MAASTAAVQSVCGRGQAYALYYTACNSACLMANEVGEWGHGVLVQRRMARTNARTNANGVGLRMGSTNGVRLTFCALQSKVQNVSLTPDSADPGLRTMPLQRAQALLDAHAEAYPGVAAWIARVHELVANTGEVRTLYGRRRYLPNIFSASPADAAEARRQAVNMIIQGTAADLLKLALIRPHNALPEEVRMLLPVHDSVLFETREEHVEQVLHAVIDAMECVPDGFSVPLEVKVKTGKTWAECKPRDRLLARVTCPG